MPPQWTILHAGALGDLVLTVQLALRLPRVALQGELQLVARADLGDLAGCRPALRRICPDSLHSHWLHADGGPPPASLAGVVRGARVLSALAGPDSTVHARLQQLAPAELYSFDPRPRGDCAGHIVDQWQRDLELQGLLFDRCVTRLRRGRSLGVPPAMRERGAALLRAAGVEPQPGLMLLHPGSGGRAKCWPLSCFLDLARWLGCHTGLPSAFAIGEVERACWPASEIARLRAAGPVLSDLAPADFAAVLSAAVGFIGNDAGPAHLSALLGTPTVALFGPTRASRWRPLGVAVTALQADAESGPDWGLSVARIGEEVRRLRNGSAFARNVEKS